MLAGDRQLLFVVRSGLGPIALAVSLGAANNRWSPCP